MCRCCRCVRKVNTATPDKFDIAHPSNRPHLVTPSHTHTSLPSLFYHTCPYHFKKTEAKRSQGGNAIDLYLFPFLRERERERLTMGREITKIGRMLHGMMKGGSRVT